jgi:hypothetical protein
MDTNPIRNPRNYIEEEVNIKPVNLQENTRKLDKLDIIIGTALALWSVGMILRGLKNHYNW